VGLVSNYFSALQNHKKNIFFVKSRFFKLSGIPTIFLENCGKCVKLFFSSSKSPQKSEVLIIYFDGQLIFVNMNAACCRNLAKTRP
jgi:hypothetical protein